MSLMTNVHAENRSERRLSVFIFNLIIFVMSFFILLVYATQPFFSVKANAELTKDNLAELIEFENEDIDVMEVLPESVTLELVIGIGADVIFDTSAKVLNQLIFNFNLDADLTDAVTALVDDNVNLLVDQIIPEIEAIALTAAKQIAITKGKDALLAALVENDSTTDFEQKLEEAGFGDEYIDEKMEEIITSLREDGATTESVADTVVQVMQDIVADLNESDDESLYLQGVNEQSLKADVMAGLDTFADAEGNIDMDTKIADLFNKAFSVATEESEGEKPTASTSKTNDVVLLSEQSDGSAQDTVEELKDDIRNTIMSKLGDDVHKTVSNFLKAMSLLLIFSMFMWIYLMIKILVKTFMKDNTVKFKMPILFGALPGLLWLIPSIFMYFISHNPEFSTLPYSIGLEFFASGWLAVLGALVLIIICAPYASLRKGLKPKKLKKVK